jgi:hypothetical protein
MLPLHLICGLAARDGQEHWAERIRKLVQLYPKGAGIPDVEEILPLEHLVRPTVTFGHVRPVLEAFPSALARLNLPETLYPYVLSKLTMQRSSTAIFQIIRETPTLAAIR